MEAEVQFSYRHARCGFGPPAPLRKRRSLHAGRPERHFGLGWIESLQAANIEREEAMTGSRLGGHRTLRSRAGQFPGSRKLMFYRATSLRIMHPIDFTMGA